MLCETRGIAATRWSVLGIDCKLAERTLLETVTRDEVSVGYLNCSLRAQPPRSGRGSFYGAEHPSLRCARFGDAATDILMLLGAEPRYLPRGSQCDCCDGDWQRWLADHPELRLGDFACCEPDDTFVIQPAVLCKVVCAWVCGTFAKRLFGAARSELVCGRG